MITNIICFSDDYKKTEDRFRDLMNHYQSEYQGREGLHYDKSISFSEKEKQMDVIMRKEISRISGLNFGDSPISKEMLAANPTFKWASMAVVNSLIDMIIPEIIIRDTGVYTEQRVGGYGDSFTFDVEPNDLFYVSKAGRGQRTVEFQKQFNTKVSINPEEREISVAVSFYKVLCGQESLAKFAMKAVLSMESEINRDIYKAFDTAMSALPTTPVDGALKVVGWDEDAAVNLAQTVSAWNRNSKAIFLGTQLALRNIMPKDANYRYFLDSEYVRIGYVRDFMGIETMVMPQIADWRTPYKTFLSNDKIYVISPGSQKPVKLCLEGASRTNTIGHYDTADLTESATIYKSWGIGIATNAIAGIIELN